MAKLTLHEVTGSPNNVKARIALGYKGLSYERVPVDYSKGFPGDRSAVIAASTQPRTPVLIHDGHVIFDSGAILRYLDANFVDTPQLYSNDYEEMAKIEEWELWSRVTLGPSVNVIFANAFQPEPDLEACRKATAEFHENVGRIEATLGESKFLVRDSISGADVTLAPAVNLALLPDSAATNPIGKFFVENFRLGDARDRTREWVRTLVGYDEETSGK